jgi:hypothetical protein
MGGFDLRRQQSVKRTTCLKRFRALYGSNPIVYAQIIEDLQTTHSFVSSTDIPMSLASSEDALQGQKQRRRHFASLRQIRLRQNSLRHFQIV